jgi:predicted small secreted protein
MTRTYLAALLLATLGLAACNTVNGAGKDISDAGKGVSNTATDVEKKM